MIKHKTIDQIESEWNQYVRPEAGDIYKYYKGDLYEIVTTGFIETTLEPSVVYRSLTTHLVWVRTAAAFFEKVDHQGTSTIRFTLLKNQ